MLDRVWQLRATVTPYDATYVALAEALGCALVTADGRLARASGLSCPVTVVPRQLPAKPPARGWLWSPTRADMPSRAAPGAYSARAVSVPPRERPGRAWP
ncbi:type II toxin-antitoxin system VapC family toxin [Geodermatophilus telluris]|uniref:type II toxin-antitoxin system VapC family toxin n=1 Tax=Geodermatophilus telluris TaxID=1190417 RepID=UPI003CCBC31F